MMITLRMRNDVYVIYVKHVTEVAHVSKINMTHLSNIHRNIEHYNIAHAQCVYLWPLPNCVHWWHLRQGRNLPFDYFLTWFLK